ncbi:hypothetical protein QVD17_19409 [Tagetes erecta]|uniref:Uncharacterized protein n=1 Tax=Tagetes erecta TaxID=13708 RepID=A0AAD8NWX7_TARER|nr:hypothetical protein QVD17_19409 [Tagetes erecta]
MSPAKQRLLKSFMRTNLSILASKFTMVEFGYGFIPRNLRFYFKHPVGDLDIGLFPLRNSEDVTLLTSYIGVNGVREIELYVVTEELNEDTGKDIKSGTWRPHVREDAPVCRRLF